MNNTQGRVISVINHKGGVGKTTVSVNLGAALAIKGYRVLLVDIDPQMSATGILIHNTEGVLKSNRTFPNLLITYLAGKPIQFERWLQYLFQGPLSEDKKSSSGGTFALLAGDLRTERVEKGLFSRPHSIERLLRKLNLSGTDYILFDCPPALSRLTMSALMASDAFLVPVVPDLISIRGIETLLQKTTIFFDRIRSKNWRRPVLEGILFNRLSYQKRIVQKKSIVELEQRFKAGFFDPYLPNNNANPFFQSQISDRSTIAQAADARLPVGLFAPNSDSAIEFDQLADELVRGGRL